MRSRKPASYSLRILELSLGPTVNLTLVYSCIAPHGGEIIPELASKSMLAKFETTRASMKTLASKMVEARPHTIVLATPHNLRLWKQIAVVTTENSSGILRGASRKSVSLHARCDRKFAGSIVEASEKAKLPVVGANYGTAEGSASDMQMDWGTLVPLWFVLSKHRVASKLVIVAPSREIPLRLNFEFGQLLGKLMQKDTIKRFVFIASADQAHAHLRSGPYGYDPAASKYDDIVLNKIRRNRVDELMSLKTGFVEHAKPDSLWQMTMLAGVISVVPSRSHLLSYEVPTYYGMACAEFKPVAAKSN